MFVEARRVPELEMRAHAEQHDVAFELSRAAQLGRDEDAAGAVEVDVRRVAREGAAAEARAGRRSRAIRSRCASHVGRRIDEQAAVRMAGEGQAAVAVRRQGIAVTAGHGKSPFAVQRQL
ncbi:MAG: hypothetical protein MZV64_48715 [Ignavibacteriales bacterium]|nr:hypothetical protein [Ignavibacteriales bacterium]